MRETREYVAVRVAVFAALCVAQHPQTEEIGLQIIATANISNMFSMESPYISNTIARESPKFQTGFHVSTLGPRHSKESPGKLHKSGDPNILCIVSSVSGWCEVCSKLCVAACVAMCVRERL